MYTWAGNTDQLEHPSFPQQLALKLVRPRNDIVHLKQIEYGVYGDLTREAKPYSIYLRGTISSVPLLAYRMLSFKAHDETQLL